MIIIALYNLGLESTARHAIPYFSHPRSLHRWQLMTTYFNSPTTLWWARWKWVSISVWPAKHCRVHVRASVRSCPPALPFFPSHLNSGLRSRSRRSPWSLRWSITVGPSKFKRGQISLTLDKTVYLGYLIQNRQKVKTNKTCRMCTLLRWTTVQETLIHKLFATHSVTWTDTLVRTIDYFDVWKVLLSVGILMMGSTHIGN